MWLDALQEICIELLGPNRSQSQIEVVASDLFYDGLVFEGQSVSPRIALFGTFQGDTCPTLPVGN